MQAKSRLQEWIRVQKQGPISYQDENHGVNCIFVLILDFNIPY